MELKNAAVFLLSAVRLSVINRPLALRPHLTVGLPFQGTLTQESYRDNNVSLSIKMKLRLFVT
jgi:hypothetical protein